MKIFVMLLFGMCTSNEENFQLQFKIGDQRLTLSEYKLGTVSQPDCHWDGTREAEARDKETIDAITKALRFADNLPLHSHIKIGGRLNKEGQWKWGSGYPFNDSKALWAGGKPTHDHVFSCLALIKLLDKWAFTIFRWTAVQCGSPHRILCENGIAPEAIQYSKDGKYALNTYNNKGTEIMYYLPKLFRLAEIYNENQFSAAKEFFWETGIKFDNDFFIGGKKIDGKWSWYSGSRFDFNQTKLLEFWGIPQPDDHDEKKNCLVFSPKLDFKWSSVSCDSKLRGLAESVFLYSNDNKLVLNREPKSKGKGKCPENFRQIEIYSLELFETARQFLQFSHTAPDYHVLIGGRHHRSEWRWISSYPFQPESYQGFWVDVLDEISTSLNVSRNESDISAHNGLVSTMSAQNYSSVTSAQNYSSATSAQNDSLEIENSDTCLAFSPKRDFKWNNVPCEWKLPTLCETVFIHSSDGKLVLNREQISRDSPEGRCPKNFRLVEIYNKFQFIVAQNFLKSAKTPPSFHVLIGGRETKTDWTWISGYQFNFELLKGLWADGEPTEGQHCLAFSPKMNFKWNNVPCKWRMPSLCETVFLYSKDDKYVLNREINYAQDAMVSCPLGYRLAEIYTEEIFEAVKSFLETAYVVPDKHILIGGYRDSSRTWHWYSGRKFEFQDYKSFFKHGEPFDPRGQNEDRLAVAPNWKYKWNNVRLDIMLPSLCEKIP